MTRLPLPLGLRSSCVLPLLLLSSIGTGRVPCIGVMVSLVLLLPVLLRLLLRWLLMLRLVRRQCLMICT